MRIGTIIPPPPIPPAEAKAQLKKIKKIPIYSIQVIGKISLCTQISFIQDQRKLHSLSSTQDILKIFIKKLKNYIQL